MGVNSGARKQARQWDVGAVLGKLAIKVEVLMASACCSGMAGDIFLG